jgi:hypothetical protein
VTDLIPTLGQSMVLSFCEMWGMYLIVTIVCCNITCVIFALDLTDNKQGFDE